GDILLADRPLPPPPGSEARASSGHDREPAVDRHHNAARVGLRDGADEKVPPPGDTRQEGGGGGRGAPNRAPPSNPPHNAAPGGLRDGADEKVRPPEEPRDEGRGRAA